MTKSLIVIGVPIAPDCKIDFRLSMWIADMCLRPNVIAKYEVTRFCAESVNRLIHFFLSVKEATHLFLVDADTSPTNSKTLDLLLAPDKDIVTGVCPIIHHLWGIRWGVMHYEDGGLTKPYTPIKELPEKVFRASDANGPYLIKREVLEKKMTPPYFFDIFDHKTGARILSQDLFFVRKAAESGVEIWCEPKAVFNHRKTVDLQHLIEKVLEMNDGSSKCKN